MNAKPKDISPYKFLLFLLVLYGCIRLFSYVLDEMYKPALAYDQKSKNSEIISIK